MESPSIPKESEHSLDLLIDVIQGRLGTPAQRNAIIRVLRDVTIQNAKRNTFVRLAGALGIDTPRHQGTHLHELAPRPFPPTT